MQFSPHEPRNIPERRFVDSESLHQSQSLDQFNEELAKPAPRKSLLKRSWDNLVQVLPTVTTVAGAAAAIAKLFG
jgi:hypothetical protein